jgi:hypothetical protein
MAAAVSGLLIPSCRDAAAAAMLLWVAIYILVFNAGHACKALSFCAVGRGSAPCHRRLQISATLSFERPSPWHVPLQGTSARLADSESQKDNVSTAMLHTDSERQHAETWLGALRNSDCSRPASSSCTPAHAGNKQQPALHWHLCCIYSGRS